MDNQCIHNDAQSLITDKNSKKSMSSRQGPQNQNAPPRVSPSLRKPPKIRQVYWCDFPQDAQIPEFWKRRPVLILSRSTKLYGSTTVLPLTTKPQTGNSMVYEMVSPIGGQKAWVICNYLTTVAVSRLHLPSNPPPRVNKEDFRNILTIVMNILPSPDH